MLATVCLDAWKEDLGRRRRRGFNCRKIINQKKNKFIPALKPKPFSYNFVTFEYLIHKLLTA